MLTKVTERLDSIYDNKKYRIISGSVLKIIALFTMLIDHTASVLLREMSFADRALFTVGSHRVTLYYICRLIGRLAFPIYCFLITEGYIHTHDRKKYGINLLIFAFVSEIPWNLEHTGKMFYSKQNVFFTLFLGYFAICIYEKYKEEASKLLLSMLAVFVLSILLRADYGSKGMGVILLMYILREKKVIQAILCSCFLSTAYSVIFAFVPINMYNGERGFIKSKAAKYAFYAAYPVHILLLYILKNRLFGY